MITKRLSIQTIYNTIVSQALPPVTDEKLFSSLPSTDSMQLHRDAALYDLAVYAHNYCFQVPLNFRHLYY